MSISKILKHNRFWQILGLIALDIIFFGRTNAGNVTSYLLIVGFLLVAFSVYELIYCLLSISRLYGLPVKHKNRLSIYMTGVLSAVLALQSIGELGSRDVLVLLPLALLGYIYSAYGKADKKQNR